MKTNEILNGDCLDLMPSIPSKSVDMILCDLPYGTTDNKWDFIIDPLILWDHYKRVIKDNGIICLTTQGIFTAKMIMSNEKWYNHEYIWAKNQHSNFALVGFQPLRVFENILVYKAPYKGGHTFNFDDRIKSYSTKNRNALKASQFGDSLKRTDKEYVSKEYENYPRNILYFDCERGQHPTQKPVALFEYLIKTYTNEGEIVLDNCSGSGTTAIACLNSNRRFICMEKDETYYKRSLERIANHEPLLYFTNHNEN